MLPGACPGPLAVERAIELLAGPTGRFESWFRVGELSALTVGGEESLRRMTVSQETDASREGVAFRRERARRAQAAGTLQDENPAWPPAVSDLRGGFRFGWVEAIPHCNVMPIEGTAGPATLLYLGENPEDDVIEALRAKLERALRRHAVLAAVENAADATEAMDRALDRLCIAYRRNHRVQFFGDSSRASITEPRTSREDDIARGVE
jgi:hypothetical protein